MFQNNGITTHEVTLGATADIINLCVYGWYEWTYYCNSVTFPENRYKLGRVLGLVKNEGNQMAQSIRTSKGTVVTRQTMHKL